MRRLKSAYNVQIAVNSEYITGIETFSDRTDLGTLVPFLEELKRQHKGKYAEVTADAGYESLENYLCLEKNGQRMCRSIQVDGAFGLLKNDFGFRRFLTRGKANIRTRLFFLALAYDLKKLWMKRENRRLKTHLSEITVV